MSYHRSALQRYGARRRPMRPLSDFDTSWLDPNYISHWAASNAEQAKEMSCLTDANMSSAVSALDAQTLNLAKTWNPTGFYSAADVNKLYTTVSTLIAQARIPLATAPFTTSDSDMVVKQAGHDLDRALTKGQAYLDAMQQAQARGLATIDAPGMKMWVLNSLNAVSSAYVTVAALQCRKTWLDTAAGWIASAIAAIKSVIGVILKAGELALKVAGDTLDFVAMVSKYLPWAALGVAAYWVYTKASTWQRS